MEKTRPFVPMIIIIVLEAVLGVFLTINPVGFTEVLIRIIGIVLLIGAVIGLVHIISGVKNQTSVVGPVIGSILALIFGLLCLCGTGWILGIISIFAWIYGLILIIGGVLKFASFAQVRNAGLTNKSSYLILISAIIMIVFGIILVIRPFGTVELLLRIGGILLIVEAIFDLITMIINMKGMNAAS